MYTSESYFYGRFTARIQFAAGDGVVSSFFLWKDGSEKSGTFWNELDFEKLGADCHLETNAYFGNPGAVHSEKAQLATDLCGGFHTYMYEWTPDYIAWFVDGAEVRRETGATATAYRENATKGMQLRFNIWPGNASFGGNFSPAILPVHEYINWVEYSSYADGEFKVEWRDDFSADSLPSRWLTGNWESPKNLSTHGPANVNVADGYLILSLTADDATGPAGAAPKDDASGSQGTGGTGGASGSGPSGGAGTGMPATGGAGGAGRTGGASSAGGAGGVASGGGGDSRPPATGGAAGGGRANGASDVGGASGGRNNGDNQAPGAGGVRNPGKPAAGDGRGGDGVAGGSEEGDETAGEPTTSDIRSDGCSLRAPHARNQGNPVAVLAAVVGAVLYGRRRSRAKSGQALDNENGD